MAQSLRNKFLSNGSRLGYPNNPAQPQETGIGPSSADRLSTLHDLYSYDGTPDVPGPRFPNSTRKGVGPLPSPTDLQAFTGPSNLLAAGAGFNQYNNRSTYDSFVLAQGAGVEGFVDRIDSSGNTFLR